MQINNISRFNLQPWRRKITKEAGDKTRKAGRSVSANKLVSHIWENEEAGGPRNKPYYKRSS
jgi:hypothetical protein